MKIVEQFEKQISKKINQQSYKRRILQTSFQIVSEQLLKRITFTYLAET